MTNSADSGPALESDAEALRVAAVRRYEILDTPKDGAFDRITAVAASLFDVPIAIISLVDHDRIWFKSHHGLDVEQIDREPGLCASAVLQNGPWIVENAAADARALANPLVAGEFGLRFYAGVPLRTSDGYNLGTLCVIDQEPRTPSEKQILQLEALGAVVLDQMELRLAARKAARRSSSALDSLVAVVAEKDAALKLNALMAKEVDHRVMNSLQMVSSLLALQSRSKDGQEAAEQLAVAAQRVAAVARVHQHMYLGENAPSVAAKDYLERFCEDISKSLGGAAIVVVCSEVDLLSQQVLPIGLIVNELATNAAKNGADQITVVFEKTLSNNHILSVSDNGRGLPSDFDPKGTAGLGLRLLISLANQLGGTPVFSRQEIGARITIRF